MACRYSLYTLLCIDEWEKSRVIGLLISSSQRAVHLAPHVEAFAEEQALHRRGAGKQHRRGADKPWRALVCWQATVTPKGIGRGPLSGLGLLHGHGILEQRQSLTTQLKHNMHL